MLRTRPRAIASLALLSSLSLSSAALAQGRSAVHVVTLDSDDSSEDNADAVTGALKSRVRATSGWQLAETNDSMAMLLPALKCPPKPDAACLDRIGEQLKTDRYFWGSVSKGPSPGYVSADVHLWIKGRADQAVKEVFSENLKDQNDDAVRKIATHAFEKLTGTSQDGAVTVKSSANGGTVFIDGQPKGVLQNGTLTLSLPVGKHHVEVRAEGMATAEDQVSITPGSDVGLTLEPGKTPATKSDAPSKPLPVMRIAALATAGVGVLVLAAGGYEGVSFLSEKSDYDAARGKIPKAYSDVCSTDTTLKYGSTACDGYNTASSTRSLAFILAGSGALLVGAGAVLLALDKPSGEKPATTAVHVVPAIAPGTGGLTVVGAF